MTTLASINSPEATQSRLEAGRIPHFGPILMLCARPALLLLAQGITFLHGAHLSTRLSSTTAYYRALVNGPVFGPFYASGWIGRKKLSRTCSASVVGFSEFLGWLRLRSNSLWPRALAHANFNLALDMADGMTATNPARGYLLGESGHWPGRSYLAKHNHDCNFS